MVEEIVERYGRSLSIFDPFCGTGTTALSAVNHGHRAGTTDINPFLIWLARTKTGHYSATEIANADRAGVAALDLAWREAVNPVDAPPIHKIERWWSEPSRRFLCHLKSAIATTSGNSGPAADLLSVAFCRTLIRLSNASFNHQSMSFKDKSQLELGLERELNLFFQEDLSFIIETAKENPRERANIFLADARDLSGEIQERFDVVITSPPYANRMSYIRELRPYMYWLGYLTNGRDAAELDWAAIGGTWGIATSRLSGWSASGTKWLPSSLPAVLDQIAQVENTSGALLSKYVAKYCEDMSAHFAGIRSVLNSGARLHYIVGNSTFYNVLVSTEQFYAVMLERYGFTDIEIRPIRKRNSKKELVEFDVSATWPG
jgi:hypothetical protein